MVEGRLGATLLDLLTNGMYRDETLSSKALRLFIRLSSTTELATALEQVQLLLDPRSVYIYQEIEARSAALGATARRLVFLRSKVDEHFFRAKEEAEKRGTRQLMESSGWFESLEQPDAADPMQSAEEFFSGIGRTRIVMFASYVPCMPSMPRNCGSLDGIAPSPISVFVTG